jgi:signal transduction histidine kinase
VRVRLTLVAVAAVGMALGGGAGLLVILLRHSLVHSATDTAKARALEVATLVSTEGPRSVAAELQGGRVNTQVVQVLDQHDNVVAASISGVAQRPLGGLRPPPGSTMSSPPAEIASLDPDDRYVLVARGAAKDDTSYVVVVAADLSTQDETVSTVAGYLAIAFPLLVILVGASTFVLVGRALRPVERIRSRVAGIGARQLADRVPVPATGDEIARLAVTMNEMLDRLESARDSQHRFIADASHELRSPLATLRASLDVIGADPGGSPWLDLRQTMAAEAERMGCLVEDLLLLAQADEHGLNYLRTDVDLDDLLAAETRRLRASALDVSAEIRPVRVTGDRAKLAQALRNLTDNAARHANGQVRLRLGTQGAWARVQIDDDGPGIPEPDRARVFDRFVRLDNTRERSSGGCGLGLYIAIDTFLGHGGTVAVETTPLVGARLTVLLPRGETLSRL